MQPVQKNDLEPLTVTVEQAKKMSNLSEPTIFKCLRDGRLRGTKVGRRRLIYTASIKQMLGLTDKAA